MISSLKRDVGNPAVFILDFTWGVGEVGLLQCDGLRETRRLLMATPNSIVCLRRQVGTLIFCTSILGDHTFSMFLLYKIRRKRKPSKVKPGNLNYNFEQFQTLRYFFETVAGLSTAKGMAFALQHNSPFTREFTLAILRLQENGFLEGLRRKWWHVTSNCPQEEDTSKK